MTYNIMAVNPGHNGSVCLLVDGEVVYYIEEERLSRQKHDGNPFRGILDILSKWHVDEVVVGGTAEPVKLPWNGEDPYTALVRKFNKNVKTTDLSSEHHIGHAASAFYNSGFDKAVAVIVDGAGSFKREFIDDEGKIPFEGYETESMWVCEYPAKFGLIRKVYGNNIGVKMENNSFDTDNAVTITKTYEAASQYLGFGFIEAGKTMGLAPYGQYDPNMPQMYVGNRGSKDVFVPHYPAGAFIDEARLEYFRRQRDPREWHFDESLLSDVEKNVAWAVQQGTQNIVAHYIKSVVEMTGINKVVIAGGYGLNCVANYFFKKALPEVELYCEPIAHDGGTVIGLAKFVWQRRQEELEAEGLSEFVFPAQQSIYYGPQYTTEQLQSTLEQNSSKIKTKKVKAKDVAKLLSERNIVALFQGRSEAGPRALGNRSILYDPRDPDGKNTVNEVKGREWFRPFAGTVLKEDCDEWFDMAGMEESPFMMYAVNVVADKLSQIPAILHVDDTCRVQTVSEEQNPNYYKLIKEFKGLTGVPCVFNTSFNLAGDPLCETLQDALDTLYNSKLSYLYLPELELLVEKL